jgi:hypothetical protein
LRFFDIFENPIVTSGLDANIVRLLTQYVPENEIFRSFCDTDSFVVPLEWMAKHSNRKVTYVQTQTSYWQRGNNYGRAYNAGAGSMEDPLVQWAERSGMAYYGHDPVTDQFENDDEAIHDQYRRTFVDPKSQSGTNVTARIRNETNIENDEFVDSYDVPDALATILDAIPSQQKWIIDQLIEEGFGDMIKESLDDYEMLEEPIAKEPVVAAPLAPANGQKGGINLTKTPTDVAPKRDNKQHNKGNHHGKGNKNKDRRK